MPERLDPPRCQYFSDERSQCQALSTHRVIAAKTAGGETYLCSEHVGSWLSSHPTSDVKPPRVVPLSEPEYSDVFPDSRGGIQRPRTVDKEDLLDLLDYLKQLVLADDSMEGTLMYAWSMKEPGRYDIAGVLRTGNSEGQGGVSVLWDFDTQTVDTPGYGQ